MLCECCGKFHNKEYGSGRFCNASCARRFSTKEKRQEINEKVHNKMKGQKCSSGRPFKKGIDERRFPFTTQSRIKATETKRKKRKEFLDGCTWEQLPLYEKRLVVLQEQEYKCNACHILDWMSIKLTLEFHHKDGNTENNVRSNIEFLCPNCHSQTPNYRNKNSRDGGTGIHKGLKIPCP